MLSPSMLALIPARGGSRGIPGKNTAQLAGRPLIAHTLEVACQLALFDDVVVSTDSEAIAEVGKQYGARVPFLRPAELSHDSTPMFPVVEHALDWLSKHERRDFLRVMVLLPTTPLRQVNDLLAAVAMLNEDPSADAVVSVCRVDEPHPYKLLEIRDGYVHPFIKQNGGIYYGSRQALPPVYARNGALYLVKVSKLRLHGTLLGHKARAYEMSPERSVNIDSPLDLLLAEALLQRSKS